MLKTRALFVYSCINFALYKFHAIQIMPLKSSVIVFNLIKLASGDIRVGMDIWDCHYVKIFTAVLSDFFHGKLHRHVKSPGPYNFSQLCMKPSCVGSKRVVSVMPDCPSEFCIFINSQ